ncbi:nuclear mRNA export, poly(A)+RNA binding protein [Kluyveromyces marxianus]|nr:nuclear mRNA export, poly(A)+RNA binding protein [Kluyveromyces marxianus]KAG0685059.1 nuclear mRNA export, poly(A)+RNA binding protein [Kluyveromyces marxianus]
MQVNGFSNMNQIGALAQQNHMDNLVGVNIRGWTNATQQDLLNFISRKTRISVRNSVVQGDTIVGYVTPQEADQLVKFSGYRFAGNTLKIQKAGGSGGNVSTNDTITVLRNVLMRRYNAQTKMLDLGNLFNDPELVQRGMAPKNVNTQSKMFPAMMKVASKEPYMVVESINLSDNNLRDVNGVTTLAQTFPRLKNLCLANNNINRFHSLEAWKNKFKDLRELLMMNNPITSDRLYRTEMLRIFPKLVILDNVVVRDEQKLLSIYSLPTQQTQFFFEDSGLASSSTDFVTNFLNLWDTNRMQLMGLYTPQSQFSISVDSSVPAATVPNAQTTPTFGYYLPFSRNISKISSDKTIQERIFMGPEAIYETFRSLPVSKHFLQEQPQAYSVQAWTFPQVNGFVITLHGHFDETAKPEMDKNKTQQNSSSSRGRRYNHGFMSSANTKLSQKSFDRTMVLVPNPNGSVIIASDALTIRPFCDGAWSNPVSPPATVQPPMVQPQQQQQPQQQPQPINIPLTQTPPNTGALGTTTLQLPPEVQAKLSPIQLELLQKLHVETKLNAEYTYMLAEQSMWNYDSAMQGFRNSVNNLPREAFV